ncbi:MAG: hypothetical protein K6T81_13950 [Alicyclobacillus macrosporangiidus]|uniref:hypothetical protein n=1 Tax=Alicyclobacillus macrosporangiidus TaxID=392015 RepID=UPI0026EE590D|nr:hypothetical protein [Alicyclobacillus macrosporangiidus]MCL6599819.1 hypothetical protein [Alicyclobacillus macrosporangiidus]
MQFEHIFEQYPHIGEVYEIIGEWELWFDTQAVKIRVTKDLGGGAHLVFTDSWPLRPVLGMGMNA